MATCEVRVFWQDSKKSSFEAFATFRGPDQEALRDVLESVLIACSEQIPSCSSQVAKALDTLLERDEPTYAKMIVKKLAACWLAQRTEGFDDREDSDT